MAAATRQLLGQQAARQHRPAAARRGRRAAAATGVGTAGADAYRELRRASARWPGWTSRPTQFEPGTLGGGLLAGLLFAVEFGCMFVGLQYTTASRMVVFLYLAPFVVALGMPFISAQRAPGPLAGAGAGDGLRRRGLGLCRGAGRRQGGRCSGGRRAGRGRGRAVGPDDAGDARQPAGHAPRPRRRCSTSWPVGRWRWAWPRCWPASPGRSA
jgi:hypothetical protein